MPHKTTDINLSQENIVSYLTTKEAAEITSFSTKALETMRAKGHGPEYFRIGRNIRYKAADVVSWIEGGQA